MALSLKLSEILLNLNGVKRYNDDYMNDNVMLVADHEENYEV